MKKRNRVLLLIVLTGCLFQVLCLFIFMLPDTLAWPDPRHYLKIATALANGESYSSDIYNLYRSPGYPFFLSFFIRIFGNDVLTLRFIHIALYSVFLLGVYKLGKLWNGHSFALLFTFLSSLYPFFLYIPLTLYPEALLIFLTPWIFFLFLKIEKDPKFTDNIFIAGILISLAVLTRPTYIIVPVTFIIYLAFTKKIFSRSVLNATSFSRKNLNYILKIGLIIGILPLVFTTLWGFRNLKVHSRFIISTSSSVNLFYSFNENTTINTKSDVPIPKDIAYKITHVKNDFQRDSIYKETAIEFIKENPRRSIILTLGRMYNLWNPIPFTITRITPLKTIVAAIPYTLLLLLSVLGFYKLRHEKFIIMLIAILIINTVLNGFFGASVRYRVIFDIVLILMATHFLFQINFIRNELKKIVKTPNV